MLENIGFREKVIIVIAIVLVATLAVGVVSHDIKNTPPATFTPVAFINDDLNISKTRIRSDTSIEQQEQNTELLDEFSKKAWN